MRLRTILAASLLGLAVAGVTLARQQTGNSPQRGQGPAAVTARQLRVQVAELRADVELGEIQHEVDKAMLSEMMKEIEQAQWKEASKPIQAADSTAGRQVTALGNTERKDKIDLLWAEVKQRKEMFRKRAIILHGMKFELADLEERLAKGWGL